MVSPRSERTVNMTRPNVGTGPAAPTGVGRGKPGRTAVAAPVVSKQPTGGAAPIRLEAAFFSPTGCSYQWEESLAGEDDWSNVAGGEAQQPTLNAAPEESKDYRCTCTNEQGSIITDEVAVTGTAFLGALNDGDDMDASDTSLVLHAGQGANFEVGDVIQALGSDELMVVDAISTDTLTVLRGWNETTPEAILDDTQVLLVIRAAWEQSGDALGTSAEAMDASETGLDVVDDANFVDGMLIQGEGETEVMHVQGSVTNTVTVQRAAIGTTGESSETATDFFEVRPVGFDA